MVLLEIKNPADENANVWKAYDQMQTYKEQIPDVFQTNEVLVISDGTEALMGSLSSDAERFMAWRTIDGQTLDPLGEFNELQTLVRGVLAPSYLLDYATCPSRTWRWSCWSVCCKAKSKAALPVTWCKTASFPTCCPASSGATRTGLLRPLRRWKNWWTWRKNFAMRLRVVKHWG